MAKAIDEILAVAQPSEWRAWLAEHHASSLGVWLRVPKRGAFSYPEVLDIALMYGWIDSQKRGLDPSAWLQRFTPRTARSPWSKLNRARAEALAAAGLLQPAGLAEVARARSDGRWERAYDGARTSAVPDDLAAALATQPRARKFFDELDSANRYAILSRVQTAKKPETRAARIAKFVAMCSNGETIHQRKRGDRH